MIGAIEPHFAIIVFLVINGFMDEKKLGGFSYDYDLWCPNGKTEHHSYDGRGSGCASHEVALGFAVYEEYMCCRDVNMCTATGMRGRFLAYNDGGVIYYGINKNSIYCDPQVCGIKNDNNEDANYVRPYIFETRYRDDKNSFLCPYPMGYMWFESYRPKEGQAFPSHVMPVDYFGTNSILFACETNKQCGVDKFCGDVINFSYENTMDRDKWLYRDTTRRFCYNSPPFKHYKKQRMMLSTGTNMVLCNRNEDCYLESYEEITECIMEYRPQYVAVKEIDGVDKRCNFKGFCVEAKPVAFLYRHLYLNLPEQATFAEMKRFFPVDMEEFSYMDELRQCKQNSDCASGQFCGYKMAIDDVIVHFTDREESEKKFCYSVPTIPAPRNETLTVLVHGDRVGFTPCNTFDDCLAQGVAHSFCYTEIGEKYETYFKYKITVFNGLCVAVATCRGLTSIRNEPFKWDAGSTVNSKPNGKCDTNEECLYDQTHAAYCIADRTYPTMNFCCYVETQKCTPDGSVINPMFRCGANSSNLYADQGPFAECNGGYETIQRQASKLINWCDTSINQCCQHSQNVFCPDGQTPLFNEPECVNYTKTDPFSGTCLAKEHAMCKYGHCCPKAKAHPNAEFERDEHSYITNQPCVPGVRPKQFDAGYCDPGLQKVIIMGQLSVDGSPLQITGGYAMCHNDLECSNDNSSLCIYPKATAYSYSYCYNNPLMVEKEEEPFPIVIIIIIIAIVIIFIIIAALIGGVIFYKFRMRKKRTTGTKPSPMASTPTSNGSCSPAI